ncbi:hypothetical protein PJN25_29580, partial [Mycobacterium kansasii]
PRVAELNRGTVSAEAAELIDRLPQLYEELSFRPVFDNAVIGAAELDSMVAASGGHPFRTNNRREVTDRDLHGLLAAAVEAPGAPLTEEDP